MERTVKIDGVTLTESQINKAVEQLKTPVKPVNLSLIQFTEPTWGIKNEWAAAASKLFTIMSKNVPAKLATISTLHPETFNLRTAGTHAYEGVFLGNPGVTNAHPVLVVEETGTCVLKFYAKEKP